MLCGKFLQSHFIYSSGNIHQQFITTGIIVCFIEFIASNFYFLNLLMLLIIEFSKVLKERNCMAGNKVDPLPTG